MKDTNNKSQYNGRKKLIDNSKIFHILIIRKLFVVTLSTNPYSFFSIFVFYSPTFKTAIPTSRTQLKQQLQREQLQELERREAEKRPPQQQQTTALKVPIQSIGVDVPPQVLQVSFAYIFIFILEMLIDYLE